MSLEKIEPVLDAAEGIVPSPTSSADLANALSLDNNVALAPSRAPTELGLAGSTPHGPIDLATVSGSEASGASDQSTAAKSCDAILQHAVHLADMLKLELGKLTAAQAAGGVITDEGLRARAAGISDEWSAAVYAGLDIIGASSQPSADRGVATVDGGAVIGADGSGGVSATASLSAAEQVWEIEELRKQILSHLSRGDCTVLIRVSRRMFDLALERIFAGPPHDLKALALRLACVGESRRNAYANAIRCIRVSVTHILDFVRIFGLRHSVRSCTLYAKDYRYDRWADREVRTEVAVAEVEWPCRSAHSDSPIQIKRYLPEPSGIKGRKVVMAVLPADARLKWTLFLDFDGRACEGEDDFDRFCEEYESGACNGFIASAHFREFSVSDLDVFLESTRRQSRLEAVSVSTSDYSHSPNGGDPQRWSLNDFAVFVIHHSARIDRFALNNRTEWSIPGFIQLCNERARHLARFVKLELDVRLVPPPAAFEPSSDDDGGSFRYSTACHNARNIQMSVCDGGGDGNGSGGGSGGGSAGANSGGGDHYETSEQGDDVHMLKRFILKLHSISLEEDEFSPWLPKLAECMVRVGGHKCAYEVRSHKVGVPLARELEALLPGGCTTGDRYRLTVCSRA